MSANDPIKVYDARWESQEFSDDEIRRLFGATLTYGRQLGVDTVTITRDARLAAGRVMELAVETALHMGFRVFLRPEPISTPQSYFTTLWVSQEFPRTMGLTITASHNPAQYIGVKFTVPTVAAIGYDCGPMGGLTKVREIYHSQKEFERLSGGRLKLLDLAREYVDFSLKEAGVKDGDLAGLAVVLDCFHGSAGPELYTAIARAGAKIKALRLIPDGHFPSGSPNPTSQGKMALAVRICNEREMDAVVGIDGDGDRMVFGDAHGILTAGFVTVPLIKAVGLHKLASPAPVLYDPKVSPLALAEWGRLGVRPVLFRNGHSQIKDYMKQVASPLAAEESGHYYHRITLGKLTVTTENSILTTLLFLNALKQQPDLLRDLWSLQKQIFTTGEFNYQFDSDATRDAAMAAVVSHFVDRGASTVTATPDGIDLQGTCLSQGVDLTPGNVKLDPGWYSGYLRVATNEKAVVRSYYSASDESAGKRVELETREILAERFNGRIVE